MSLLTLRISPAELNEVRRRAKRRGQTVSAYVREAVLPATPAASVRPRLVRDRSTGCLVLRSPRGAPQLTNESVRAILADFP